MKFLKSLVITAVAVGIIMDSNAAEKSSKAGFNLFTARKGLPNSYYKLSKGENVTVAYLGGSITYANNGWRTHTFNWLKKKFPKAKLKHVNAGLGGTNSLLGSFRMDKDVLPHSPDLLVVEFAVNDAHDSYESVVKSMEGIVRKTRKQNPQIDILFLYTIREAHFKDYDAGKAPTSIRAMEAVAEHYGIPSINGGYHIYQMVRAKKLAFPKIAAGKGLEMYSRDACHPNNHGHKVLTKLITGYLKTLTPGSSLVTYPTIAPLHKDNYEDAVMYSLSQAAVLSSGWKKHDKPYQNRFDEYWTGKGGDTATIRFIGSDLYVFDVIGKDTGQFEVIVDGKSDGVRLRYDKYCPRYYRLHSHKIVTGLDPQKEHEVVIKILEKPPVVGKNKSKGTNINIGAILLKGKLIK